MLHINPHGELRSSNLSNKTRLQHKQWALKWIHVIHFILRKIAFGLDIEESTSTEFDYKQEKKEKMQTIRNFWNHKHYVDTFGLGFLVLQSSDHQAHLNAKFTLTKKIKLQNFHSILPLTITKFSEPRKLGHLQFNIESLPKWPFKVYIKLHQS